MKEVIAGFIHLYWVGIARVFGVVFYFLFALLQVAPAHWAVGLVQFPPAEAASVEQVPAWGGCVVSGIERPRADGACLFGVVLFVWRKPDSRDKAFGTALKLDLEVH